MNFHAYIINLEHATERWDYMRTQVEKLGMPYTRIEGVYGDRLQEPIKEYNLFKHAVLTGKKTNKREVGCYLSHLETLRAFLESDDEYALILEDDATLPDTLGSILQEAIACDYTWDLLRLSSSREGSYLPLTDLSDGFRLVINTRVLKSAAAYFINRRAAQLCLKKMLPICLPFDVALDRDWELGFKTACIVPFPVRYEAGMDSQIPIANRIRLLRGTTFHFFHWMARLQRYRYRTRCYRQTESSEVSS